MIHLDARTSYSFLRGYGDAEQWYDACLKRGITALGITDWAGTWGHVPFRSVFKDVKLIYGAQVAVTLNLGKDARHGIISLIANDNEGLTLLYEMVSLAHRQTYYRPRLSWKQLSDLHPHVTVIVNDCSVGDLVYFERLRGAYLAVNPRNSPILRMVSIIPYGDGSRRL